MDCTNSGESNAWTLSGGQYVPGGSSDRPTEERSCNRSWSNAELVSKLHVAAAVFLCGPHNVNIRSSTSCSEDPFQFLWRNWTCCCIANPKLPCPIAIIFTRLDVFTSLRVKKERGPALRVSEPKVMFLHLPVTNVAFLSTRPCQSQQLTASLYK